MKKKILSAALALCLCLGMVGCNSGVSQDKYQKALDENSRLESKIEELEEKASMTPGPTATPTPEPSLSPAPTKVIEFKNVKFSAPTDWAEDKTNSENDLDFTPSLSGPSLVSISVEDNEDGTSYDNESDRDLLTDMTAIVMDDYEEIVIETMQIAGFPGFYHTYSASSESVPISVTEYYTASESTKITLVAMCAQSISDAEKATFESQVLSCVNSIEFAESPALKTSSSSVVSTAKFSPTPEPAPTPEPTPSATVSQKNALKKAHSYLDFTAFSYQGLVKQLEYEKFSQEDAVYAADHCGADWNEQAAKKAQSYLDFTSFSRDGLIEQLEYEGFTHEQAVYGVDSVGL